MKEEELRKFFKECIRPELRHCVNPFASIRKGGRLAQALANADTLPSEKAKLVKAFDGAFPSFVPVWCGGIEQGLAASLTSYNNTTTISLHDIKLSTGMASCAFTDTDDRCVARVASAGFSAMVINFSMLEALANFADSEDVELEIASMVAEAVAAKEEEVYPTSCDRNLSTILASSFSRFLHFDNKLQGVVAALLRHIANPVLTTSLRLCDIVSNLVSLPWAPCIFDFADLPRQHASDMLPIWCHVVSKQRNEFSTSSATKTLAALMDVLSADENLDDLVISTDVAVAKTVAILVSHATKEKGAATISHRTVQRIAEAASRRAVVRERSRVPMCAGCTSQPCEDCIVLVKVELMEWCGAFIDLVNHVPTMFNELPDVLVDAVELARSARSAGVLRVADSLNRDLHKACGVNYTWASHRVKGDDMWVSRKLGRIAAEDPITALPIWCPVRLQETCKVFLQKQNVDQAELLDLNSGAHERSVEWLERKEWTIDRETIARHLRHKSTNPFTQSNLSIEDFVKTYPINGQCV